MEEVRDLGVRDETELERIKSEVRDSSLYNEDLAPKFISFRAGGIITAILGIISFPWVLFNTVGAYIFTWLVGYGSLLGAIGAVMIADYWILRRRRLDLADLYKINGRYSYSSGWNWRAIVAIFIGVIPVLPGFFKAATTPGFSGVF